MAKEYTIKIVNWDKYQTRKVKERTVWLRLQNDFIENPNFSEFTSDERIVWIFLLCSSSKLNSAIIHVPDQCSHRVLYRCSGIDEKIFHRTIEKLKKLRIVEIRTTRGCYANDTSAIANDTLRNGTERDVTERNETKDFSSERSPDDLYRTVPSCVSLKSVFIERKVTTQVQERWLVAFPDSEWIVEEINKALAWETSNPIRRKKNFSAFMTRWLTKGWDQRKTASTSSIKTSRDYSFLKGVRNGNA